MSSAKIIKSILAGGFLFALLYLVGGFVLGPGVGDFTTPIADGYEFSDAGGYEKTIIYTGVASPKQIVVDARVDEYRMDGNNLLIARRPREGFRVGEVMHSRLLESCEYWVIDVKTHRIDKTPDSHGLHCN